MIKHLVKIYSKIIISRIIIFMGDILALILSFFIGYYVRGILHEAGFLSIPNVPIESFFPFTYLLIIYVFFLYNFKTYNSRTSFWQELKNILKALIIATVFAFFILALLKISQQVSRFILIFIGASCAVFIPAIKILLKYILYRTGLWQANALIIANIDSEFNAYCKNLRKNWYVGYRIGHIIKIQDEKDTAQIEQLSKEKLKQIIIDNNIMLPILYKLDKNNFFNIFIKLDIFFDNIKLIPDLHSLFVNNTSVEDDGKTLLINFHNNLLKFNNRAIQYMFNKLTSIIIAIFILPVLLIISVIIKIDSRGSVIYKAKRIGYKQKDIHVYKFRTMFQDADKKLTDILKSSPELRKEFESDFKLKDDPRVTKAGKFLRKTSLDELPQIFNVLKGEMNLVGPRPIVNDEIEKYGEAFYELIKVKPGISGLWQTSGRNDIGYEERVQLDLFYIKNWSLWMDIMILVRTVLVVLHGKGAY